MENNLLAILLIDSGVVLLIAGLLAYHVRHSRQERRKTEQIRQDLDNEREKTNQFQVSVAEIRRLTKGEPYMKIKFNDIIRIALDVCQTTLDGLDSFEDKVRLVMQVVNLVIMKKEFELELPESTGTRDLGVNLLAADVAARLKE